MSGDIAGIELPREMDAGAALVDLAWRTACGHLPEVWVPTLCGFEGRGACFRPVQGVEPTGG